MTFGKIPPGRASAAAPALAALVFALSAGPARAQVPPGASLEAGFREMYELHFDRARADFAAYERDHPSDPLGEAARAASYLYEEFDRKGVFTPAFFLDNKKLLGGIPDKPDASLCDAFLDADRRAGTMARARLKTNPRDEAGLFALTMADGMLADYQTVIAKKQLASLHSIREAEKDATRLLAVKPDAQDAYVAIGAGNYILGCLPAYKRALLWFGGIHGDRQRGMDQLEQAALHGNYLKPLAQALLALVALREHEPETARNLFLQLTREFPENSRFAQGLAFADRAIHAK